jgi:hypothetical protein
MMSHPVHAGSLFVIIVIIWRGVTQLELELHAANAFMNMEKLGKGVILFTNALFIPKLFL